MADTVASSRQSQSSAAIMRVRWADSIGVVAMLIFVFLLCALLHDCHPLSFCHSLSDPGVKAGYLLADPTTLKP